MSRYAIVYYIWHVATTLNSNPMRVVLWINSSKLDLEVGGNGQPGSKVTNK